MHPPGVGFVIQAWSYLIKLGQMKSLPLFLSMSVILPAFPVDTHLVPVLTDAEVQRMEAGEIIVREVDSPNPEGTAYEVVGLANAPGQVVYDVLIDYEAYPQFLSAVEKVETFNRAGEATTLNYTLKPILGFTKRYRVNIQDSAPEPGVWRVEWVQLEWPGLEPMETLADTQGSWLILERSPEQTLLRYYVYSDPGPIPFGLASVVKLLSKRSAGQAFAETLDRVERQAAAWRQGNAGN